jgi:hypothetical protein
MGCIDLELNTIAGDQKEKSALRLSQGAPPPMVTYSQ